VLANSSEEICRKLRSPNPFALLHDTAVRPEALSCTVRRTHAPFISPVVSALLSPFLLFFLPPIHLPAFSGREPELTFYALVQRSAASSVFLYLYQRRESERCCRLLASRSIPEGRKMASMRLKHQHLAIAAFLLLAAHAHASDLSAVIATRIRIEVR